MCFLMNQKRINVKPKGHDNFIRLFKRVMSDTELTPLQKIILSDVISFQIQGKRYFKTSKAVAKELGNLKTKTIQDNFQKLNKMGYLDTGPLKNSPEETCSLREAIVVDIEKWTSDENAYDSLNLDAMKPEVKDKNHPIRMLWPNRKKKTTPSVEESLTVKVKKTTDSIRIEKSNLPIVSFERINHSYDIRDAVRREIRRGVEPKFFEAQLDWEDGSDYIIDIVVKVADRDNPKQNHMRKHFIYDGWSPDAPTSLEDDLLDASENLD